MAYSSQFSKVVITVSNVTVLVKEKVVVAMCSFDLLDMFFFKSEVQKSIKLFIKLS